MSEYVKLVHRPALESWTVGLVSWSLHFNDLRSLEDNAAEITLNELKMMALFDETVLIRDADVVNHLQLLDIFTNNTADFREAVRAGIFVFPIRADADCFSQVNDRAGSARAYPDRHGIASMHLPIFDRYLADWGIITPQIERRVEANTFPTLLERVMPHLTAKTFQYDLLQKTLNEAKETYEGKHIQFGKIYEFLNTHQRSHPKDVGELIQWCRVAHVLTVPYELGLAPTSANHDIDPWSVAIVLGHSVTEPKLNRSVWFGRFPELIPDEDWIKHLSFRDIVRLRDHGFQAGYFQAVAALQHIDQQSQLFEHAYEEYLVCLSKYLQALEWQTKARFVRWQEVLADDLAKLRKEYESYWFRTPVIIGFIGGAVAMAHLSPLASAATGVIGATLELGKALCDRRRIKHPEPIAALLSRGITRTPPKKPYRSI